MKRGLKMLRVELRNQGIWGSVLALVLGSLLIGNPSAAEDAEVVVAPPGTLEFVGKNLIMKANGIFHDWRVIESSVDPDAIEDAFVVVEVALASLDTGIERRDDHLRNPDFFEVETYPLATVRIHSPRPIEDPSGEHLCFAVRFDVDLHGVEKTLDGEIVLLGSSPLVFEGKLTIDRMEFDIGPKPGFWSPMVPKAEIPVSFRVELSGEVDSISDS